MYMTKGSIALPQPRKSTAIGELAEVLRNISGAMGDTQVMLQGPNVEGWLGESAGAHASEATKIQNSITNAQQAISSAAQAIENYQTIFDELKSSIETHQTNWDNYISTYKANLKIQQDDLQRARNDATRDGYINEFDSSSWDNNIEQLKRDLEAQQTTEANNYNITVEKVDEAAYTAATSIASALNAYIPGIITDGNGERHVPNRADLGVTLFGNDSGILATEALMTDAEVDAAEAAREAEALTANGIPSKESLDAFNQKYADRLANDPFFATAFSNAFPPDKVTALGLALDGQAYPEELKTSFQKTYGAMGAAMMIATGGTTDYGSSMETPDSKPNKHDLLWSHWMSHQKALEVGGSSLDAWRSEYQKGIIAAGRSQDNPYDGVAGYTYLGQAWGLAAEQHPSISWGDSFLNGPNSVAHDVVNWDYEQRAYGTNRGVNPPFTSGNFASWDVLYNMTLGMDGNPEATRTFMASDVDLGHGSTQSMTEYLTGGRYSLRSNYVPWPDYGDQLGKVINETTSSPGADSDPKTLRIVNGFLEGYTHGLSLDNHNFPDGQDPYGHNNAALRNWSGRILEEYADDLAHELHNPTGKKGSDGSSYSMTDKSYHLTLSKELRDALTNDEDGFFKDLAYDTYSLKDENDASKSGWMGRPSALQLLSVAGAAHMRAEQVEAGLIEDSNDAKMAMNAVAGDYGTLLTHLELADYNAAIAEGVETDKHNSMVRSAIDFVYGEISFSEVKIPGFSTAIDKLKDFAYDNLLSIENADDANEVRYQATENISEYIKEVFTNNNADLDNEIKRFEDNGYDRPKLTPKSAQEYSDLLPDNEKFTDSNGNVIPTSDMTPDQIEAYNRFNHDYWNGQGKVRGETTDEIDEAVRNSFEESRK